MKFLICVLLVTSIPFFILCIGFLCSIARRGPRGVEWRFTIAYTVDLVLAACCGFAGSEKLATISGWVGYKSEKSKNIIWDIYKKLLDLIPWFGKGHCHAAAQDEGWL